MKGIPNTRFNTAHFALIFAQTVQQTNGALKCMDTKGCKNAPCHKLSSCTDLRPPNTGFKCAACLSYSGNATGYIGCTDIDDCAKSPPCGSKAKATNCTYTGANTYSCKCVSGYQSFGSGTPKVRDRPLLPHPILSSFVVLARVCLSCLGRSYVAQV